MSAKYLRFRPFARTSRFWAVALLVNLPALPCATADTHEFTLIPAGVFLMGDDSDPAYFMSPVPVHDVHVSAFLVARSPVTYAAWSPVLHWALDNGYSFDNRGQRGSDAWFSELPSTPENNQHPVLAVNWYDAVKWCNARSEMEGLTPAYYLDGDHSQVYREGRHDVSAAQVNWNTDGYRLPTEAEWEKAARGGLVGKRWPWGDEEIDGTRANYNSLYSGNPHGTTPVGSFPPNGFGLFDVAGNATEWIWDWYALEWYSQSGAQEDDTKGPDIGTHRVIRGASFNSDPDICRVAIRGRLLPLPEFGGFDMGFRIVRGFEEESPYVSIEIPGCIIPEEGRTYQIRVSSNTDWMVGESPDWVTIWPVSGDGDGVVFFQVADNDGLDSRRASVLIGDQAHTVIQSGVIPASIFATTGNWHRNGLGHLFDEWFPFVYSYGLSTWIYVVGECESGYFLWSYSGSYWAYTGSGLYPYFMILTGDRSGGWVNVTGQ